MAKTRASRGGTRWHRLAVVGGLSASPATSGAAPIGGMAIAPGAESGRCEAAIVATARRDGLPVEMLAAIAVVETGRKDPARGTTHPWPWTIDVGGVGRYFPTRAEAVAAVQALQAAGVASIDVGCMQVNLLAHPAAFRDVDGAFDPVANVRYAASFLRTLYRRDGSWGAAVAAYHSQTPSIGEPYRRLVGLRWSGVLPPGATGDPGLAPPSVRVDPAEEVDADHVMTASLRRTLVAQMAFARRRDREMGLTPTDTADATAACDAEAAGTEASGGTPTCRRE